MNIEDIVPIELEVILAMINHPIAIDHAAQSITADLFFDKDFQNIFTALIDMRQAGLPTTKATIANELLRRKNRIVVATRLLASSELGGCSPWEVPALCRDIAEAAEFRRLIALRNELTKSIEAGVPASELRSWIVTQAENGRELSSADQPELISKVMRRLADKANDASGVIESGLPSLDDVIGGFRGGQLIVLGARPSIGKSALAFQFAVAAAQAEHRTMYVSIEMPNDELGARQVANGCRLQHGEIMAGKLDATDRERIHALASEFDSVPLLLWEPTAPTLERITATIRREAASGLKMVVVDYVSLVRHTDPKKAHWERIGDITRAMKSEAKRHNIPIVLLAQVGRDTEKGEEARRPTLGDLKYSGDLEQDADVVLFLHRANRMASESEIIVSKQRNGPLRAIDVIYVGPRYHFSERQPTEWQP